MASVVDGVNAPPMRRLAGPVRRDDGFLLPQNANRRDCATSQFVPARLSVLDNKEGFGSRVSTLTRRHPENRRRIISGVGVPQVRSHDYLPIRTEAIKPGDVFLLPGADTGAMKIRADHTPDDGIFWFCSKVDTSTGDTMMIVPATDLLGLERDA